MGTVYLLKRAELAVRACIEVALADFDLTPTQFLMLHRLHDRHEVSAAALAREVGVRPQSVVETLAPLERKGLLQREASSRNRRVLHTRLTPAGQALLAEALQATVQIESELLAGLDPAQLTAMRETLTRLWSRAEKHERHPGVIRARAEKQKRAQVATRRRRSLRAPPLNADAPEPPEAPATRTTRPR